MTSFLVVLFTDVTQRLAGWAAVGVLAGCRLFEPAVRSSYNEEISRPPVDQRADSRRKKLAARPAARCVTSAVYSLLFRQLPKHLFQTLLFLP